MKNKKFSKLFAGVLAATLVVTGTLTPATSVEAATRSVTVTTQSQLNKALKNSKVTKIIIKTSEDLELTIPAKNYKKKQLIVKSPKAVITNKGNFKKVAINDAKTYTERGNKNSVVIKDTNSLKFVEGKQAKGTKVTVSADGKKLTIVENGKISSVNVKADTALTYRGNSTNKTPVTVASDGVSLNIQKPATLKVITDVKKITVSADATISVSDDVKVGEVVVAAAVDVAIEGKAEEAIPVTVNAENAKVSTTTPVKVEANAKADISLSAGAEGSEIKTAEGVTADVSNNTTAEVPVTDSKGETTKIEAGKESTPSGDQTSDKDQPAAGGGGGGSSSSGSSSTPSTPSTPAEEDMNILAKVSDDGKRIDFAGMKAAVASGASVSLTGETTTTPSIDKDGTGYYITVDLKNKQAYTLTVSNSGYKTYTYPFTFRTTDQKALDETIKTLKNLTIPQVVADSASSESIKAGIEPLITPHLNGAVISGVAITAGEKNNQYKATITLTKGDCTESFTTQEFVLVSSTEDGAVMSTVLNSLDIVYASGDNKDSVTKDITLVTQGAYGTTITWQVVSGDTAITTAGKVTRPDMESPDAAVTLRAEVTKNQTSSQKEFNLTVKPWKPCEVTVRITKSKNEDVFYNDKNVTLTAQAEYESKNEEEQGTITYKWYKDNNPIEGTTTSTCAIDTTVVGKVKYKVEVENYVSPTIKSSTRIAEYELMVNPGTKDQYKAAGYEIPVVTSSGIEATSITVKTVDTISEYTLPTGAVIRYAMSASSTAPAAGPEGHWQDSATFNNLQQDTEYYFFANVVSPYYVDQISEGVAIRTAAAPGVQKPNEVTQSDIIKRMIIYADRTSIEVLANTSSGMVATGVSIQVTLSVSKGAINQTGLDDANKEWKKVTSNGVVEFTGLDKEKIYYVVAKAVNNESRAESGYSYFEVKQVKPCVAATVSGTSIVVTAVTLSGVAADSSHIFKVAVTTSSSVSSDDETLGWKDFSGDAVIFDNLKVGETYRIVAEGNYASCLQGDYTIGTTPPTSDTPEDAKVVDTAGTTDKSDLFKNAVLYQVEATTTSA